MGDQNFRDELDAMLSGGSEEEEETTEASEESTEEESVEESVEESEEDSEEVEDSAEEPEDEEVEDSEEEDSSERVAHLLRTIEELQARLVEREETPTQTQETPEDKKDDDEVPDFLEGVEDIDDVLADKAAFNKILAKAVTYAIDRSKNLSAEQILSNLPRVINTAVGQQVTLREMVNQFYDANPDLTAVKKTVGMVANEIAAKEPGLSTQEIFDKAAVETRKLLKMKGPQKQPVKKEKKPAFIKQKGSRKTELSEESLNDIASEIAAMEQL